MDQVAGGAAGGNVEHLSPLDVIGKQGNAFAVEGERLQGESCRPFVRQS